MIHDVFFRRVQKIRSPKLHILIGLGNSDKCSSNHQKKNNNNTTTTKTQQVNCNFMFQLQMATERQTLSTAALIPAQEQEELHCAVFVGEEESSRWMFLLQCCQDQSENLLHFFLFSLFFFLSWIKWQIYNILRVYIIITLDVECVVNELMGLDASWFCSDEFWVDSSRTSLKKEILYYSIRQKFMTFYMGQSG